MKPFLFHKLLHQAFLKAIVDIFHAHHLKEQLFKKIFHDEQQIEQQEKYGIANMYSRPKSIRNYKFFAVLVQMPKVFLQKVTYDTEILPVLDILGDWQLSTANLFSWLKLN